jgi:hypothetical protein
MEDYKPIEYYKEVQSVIGSNIKNKPSYYKLTFLENHMIYEVAINFKERVEVSDSDTEDEFLKKVTSEVRTVKSSSYEQGFVTKSQLKSCYIKSRTIDTKDALDTDKDEVVYYSIVVEGEPTDLDYFFLELGDAQELYNIIKEWILTK